MSRQVRRSLALALAGLLGGLGLVLAVFGGGDALRRLGLRQTDERPAEATAAPPPGPGIAGSREARDAQPRPEAPTREGAAAPSAPAAATPAAKSAPAPVAPSFDIVRVEPNGDAVVAGRGAPNTVVEMLVDGKPVAKALADPNGQFAIVPPALPAGSSEIRLRTKAADGQESRSAQSVAVDVAHGRDRKPLVALTAPDKPTVVLSQPGAPAAWADARKPAGAGQPPAGTDGAGRTAGSGTGAGTGKASEAAKGGEAAAQPARIVSVDAQEGGRLYVTAAGKPGADLRLYLNDTLIAPGRVGPDGTVVFTIGRGVKPGQYRVRIDQVEAGSAKVAGRAEVPFTVPEPARVAAREPQAPERPDAGGAPTQGPRDAVAGRIGEGRAGERRPEDGRPAPSGPAPGQAGPGAAGSAPPRAEPGMPGAGAGTGTPGAGARPGMAGSAGPDRAPSAATANPSAAPPASGPARPGAVFVAEISTARISRGDNLWRISQRTYGRGERYTVIYDANQDQIRDPDLIYPGQIFVLPGDKRG